MKNQSEIYFNNSYVVMFAGAFEWFSPVVPLFVLFAPDFVPFTPFSCFATALITFEVLYPHHLRVRTTSVHSYNMKQHLDVPTTFRMNWV